MGLNRRLFSAVLTGAFILSLAFMPTVFANEQTKQGTEKYEIYPVPHEVQYQNGTLSLEGQVEVIYDDTIDDVTRKKVTKIFKDNDFKAPDAVKSPTKGKVHLFVGTSGSKGPAESFITAHADHSKVNFKQIDAYQLDITGQNIMILGKDTDASFYGIVSLGNILSQSKDDVIRQLTIKDYANTKIRGFIEGFYGIPWSNEDRISLMKFGGNYKMNSYVFAPKDDPYHRDEWDKLYPDDMLNEIKKMAKVGKETKTHFIWSISPLGQVADLARREGQDAAMAKLDENSGKMLAKFEQLYDVGVRQFGVLGDDVGSLPLEYVVQLMDSVSKWAKDKGDVRDTLYTPASYNSGWAWNPRELNAYEKGFADNIQILWTGSTTCAPVVQSTIDVFKHKQNNGVERRDPLFWLNWPVNDVDMSRVFLGKGEMLQPNIKHLAGVLTNPMQEAEASKISLFAIADYTWNTIDFDAQKSWDDSFKYIEPNATEALHELARHMSDAYPDGLQLSESEGIRDLLDHITKKVDKGESIQGIAPKAIKRLQEIVDAADKFLIKTKNTNLKEGLQPFVYALKDMVRADIDFLHAEQAVEEENKAVAWDKLMSATGLREQSLDYDRPVLDGGMKAKPAQKRLQPFTDNLEKKVTNHVENFYHTDVKKETAKVYTNVERLASLPIKESAAVTSIKGKTKVSLKKGEYIGVKLNRVKDLATIQMNHVKGLVLQTSLNGFEWETQKSNDDLSNARFVRLLNQTSHELTFTLDTFKVTSNEVEPKSVESKNVGLYQSNALNALDGDLSTAVWTNQPQTKGQSITYNLGQSIDLQQLKVYVNKNEGDFPRHAVIQSSMDGKKWQRVMTFGNQDGPNTGEVDDNDQIAAIFDHVDGDYRTKTETNVNQTARYLRLKVTRTKKGTGNWMKFQEIEINGGAIFPEINNPTITTTVNGKVGSGVQQLIDGKLSTPYVAANKESGEVLYHIGETGKSIQGIHLFTDSSKSLHGIVSVRTLSGWQKLGAIDKGYLSFDTTNLDTILDMKVSWMKGNAPTIYEISIDEKTDSENVESTIFTMETLLKQYADAGKIKGNKTIRMMKTHVQVIDHYLAKKTTDKAIKHMNGFIKLVNHELEKKNIDNTAAETLLRHANHLIQKWK